MPGQFFSLDNSYARNLPGCYVRWQPAPAPDPRLIFLNQALAGELRLDLAETDCAALFAGNALPAQADPIAQVYAGHQFGHFSPQLGDGRALLIGEVIDRRGCRRDIAFKGSGRTPFSRGGDGKAALGPMLREVLIGEAMHALGIPTTRALAVVTTGESVRRDRSLPGAVLTRVADSHLRVGTFEYFAARGDHERVRRLADYAMARHDATIGETPTRYLDFLNAVVERQAALIAQWMGVGFIHGVMNTDNMSIAGETIDYGPCAFMETYDPATVFSSIDTQGRYAFKNQPGIAQWNLARLAETLLPLLANDEKTALQLATSAVAHFSERYQYHWLAVMRTKLGLKETPARAAQGDARLASDWLALLQTERIDATLAWRHLADAAENASTSLVALFKDRVALNAWLQQWQARCSSEDGAAAQNLACARAASMRRVNPLYVPRSHHVEQVLAAASETGDLAPFNELLAALRQPFSVHPDRALWAEPAPSRFTESYRTFCGT